MDVAGTCINVFSNWSCGNGTGLFVNKLSESVIVECDLLFLKRMTLYGY